MTGAKVPAWAHGDLIACVDGPMAGQWFTGHDWDQRLVAAASMTAKGQRPEPITAYVGTQQTIRHPRVPEATGTIWTTEPTRHATALAATPATAHEADVLDDTADDEDGWVW